MKITANDLKFCEVVDMLEKTKNARALLAILIYYKKGMPFSYCLNANKELSYGYGSIDELGNYQLPIPSELVDHPEAEEETERLKKVRLSLEELMDLKCSPIPSREEILQDWEYYYHLNPDSVITPDEKEWNTIMDAFLIGKKPNQLVLKEEDEWEQFSLFDEVQTSKMERDNQRGMKKKKGRIHPALMQRRAQAEKSFSRRENIWEKIQIRRAQKIAVAS